MPLAGFKGDRDNCRRDSSEIEIQIEEVNTWDSREEKEKRCLVPLDSWHALDATDFFKG